MTMRRSLIMLAAAATAFHFAASVASAQSKSPFDPRLMRERSDSFAIVVQGAPRGFMKLFGREVILHIYEELDDETALARLLQILFR